MKLSHNVPYEVIIAKQTEEPVEISGRYMQELEAAARKAHRDWQNAQRRLRAAEKRATRRPTVEAFAERDRLRMEVLARLDELRRVEQLMKSQVGGSNWSGRGSVRVIPKGSAW